MSGIHSATAATATSSDRPLKKQMMHVMRMLPMMGATALFLKHQVTNGEGIAQTDGLTVEVTQNFFQLSYEEQLGVLVHEYLHVTMAHPYRGMILRRRYGDKYDHNIANIAADMICNGAIDKLSGRNLYLPKNVIDWGRTIALLKEACDAFKIPYEATELTLSGARFERLYELLIAARDNSQQCMSSDDISQDSSDGTGGGQKDEPSGANDNEQSKGASEYTDEQKTTARKIIDLTVNWENILEDLLDRVASKLTDDEIGQQVRKAAERLKNEAAQYGNLTNNLAEILKGDIPKVDTPWERRFRNISAKLLTYDRVKNRQRPGNSMLSQHAMGSRMKVWRPARKAPLRPHVVVIADSSGSVSQKAFLATLAQVSAMKRRTNAVIDLIVADTEVKSITRIDRESDLPKIEFDGRGGTSFIQPLAEAERMKADLVVYITDLCGAFPPACRVPVIWAVVPEHSASLQAPFGDIVEVDKWR